MVRLSRNDSLKTDTSTTINSFDSVIAGSSKLTVWSPEFAKNIVEKLGQNHQAGHTGSSIIKNNNNTRLRSLSETR